MLGAGVQGGRGSVALAGGSPADWLKDSNKPAAWGSPPLLLLEGQRPRRPRVRVPPSASPTHPG